MVFFNASCIDASFIDVAINGSTNSIKYHEFLSINRMSCIIRQEFVYLYSTIYRSFEHYLLSQPRNISEQQQWPVLLQSQLPHCGTVQHLILHHKQPGWHSHS